MTFLWPDVETEKGRKIAVLYGTISLALIALGGLTGALEEVFPDLDLNVTTAHPMGGVIDFIFSLVFVAAFAALALRLWRRQSFAIAAFNLILRVADAPFVFRDHPLEGLVTLAVWLLMLLFSIHGVRGAQAARRHMAELLATERRERLQSARNAIASL